MVNKLACKYCGKLYSSKGLGTHVWRTHGDGVTFNPNAGYSLGTRVAWNKGLNKYNNASVAAMSEHLKRTRTELEVKLDDDGKLKQKWSNKRVNAKKEGIPFELDYEEFMLLVDTAGLRSSQLGYSGQGYVLARVNDVGSYNINNCRFKTQTENAKEKKISEKSRAASRQNIRRAIEVNRQDPLRSQKISEGIRNSDYYKTKAAQAKIREAEYEANKDKRYSGEHNSQTGTFWITDGTNNLKWKEAKGELPQGFYRGRKI